MPRGFAPPARRRVEVCGNLKFDMAPDAALLARGRRWREVVGAPGGAGGEHARRRGSVAARRVAGERRSRRRGRCCFVVPRHPQRFDEVAALLARGGAARRRGAAAGRDVPDARRIAGAMSGSATRWARCRCTTRWPTSALLGGSFAPLGGQNLIEAAACGCPLVMGPHTFNFAQAAQLAEAAGAALRVPAMADAVAAAVGRLAVQTPGQATQGRAACLEFAALHRGAAARMAGRIAPLVASRHAS